LAHSPVRLCVVTLPGLARACGGRPGAPLHLAGTPHWHRTGTTYTIHPP